LPFPLSGNIPDSGNIAYNPLYLQTPSAPIAKNTRALYFWQILIMLTGFYTVWAVLETLGAEDYGIYNVAAGVVTMFGFLSNSMASASQLFFL
jgi:hypothetical protein